MMPMRAVTVRRWEVVIAFVALAVAFTWAVLQLDRADSRTRDLIAQNQARINDIQKSRLESCFRTYEGIRQVFRPFFAPPAQQTPKQRRDIRKFNSTIDGFKAKCRDQVTPPPVKP